MIKLCADDASKKGDVDALQKWKKYMRRYGKRYGLIDDPSRWIEVEDYNWFTYFIFRRPKMKHISVSGYYTCISIDEASQNGHVKVLDWWYKNSIQLRKTKGFEFKYTSLALNLASQNGHVDVLNWWYNHSQQVLGMEKGLELKYTKNAISWSCNTDTLNWWYQHSKQVLGEAKGLELKYDKNALKNIRPHGYGIDTLDWWHQHSVQVLGEEKGLHVIYDTDAILYACIFNQIDVLNWWYNHSTKVLGPRGLEMKYDWNRIEHYYGNQIFEWFRERNLVPISPKERINNVLRLYDNNKLKQITDLFS